MAKVRIYSAYMSRRNVLRAVAAVGLAVATTDCAFAAKPKRSQADVNYQDHPHGAERCDNCAPFVAPDSCKTVQGTVSAQGWCKIYVEK